MIKTLKRRFIGFTMLAATVLLVFIVLAINGLNWVMLERQSDAMLHALMEADGAVYQMKLNRPPPFVPPLDAERMRVSRFFVVRSDAGGSIVEVDIDRDFSIDHETAERYARTVLAAEKTAGRLEGYKFAVKPVGTARMIFFIDTAEQRGNFRTFLFASSVIAVLCWLLLWGVVVLLSGKVIRPVLAGMEKQKQFITNAGHEMKTPLAIIQSNNDTMALIHGENKYNVHIRTQTKRLDALMSNLLTLAKLDEEVAFPTEPIDVSEAAHELLPAYREAAQHRGLTFRAEIAPALVIQTHRESFRQLLTPLLDNAVKYTPAGGEITLTLEKQGKRLRLVAENPCDPDHEADPERLFERFYRGDSARTQREDTFGYGIGLSAARALCESFGGTLTADYPAADRIRFTAVL